MESWTQKDWKTRKNEISSSNCSKRKSRSKKSERSLSRSTNLQVLSSVRVALAYNVASSFVPAFHSWRTVDLIQDNITLGVLWKLPPVLLHFNIQFKNLNVYHAFLCFVHTNSAIDEILQRFVLVALICISLYMSCMFSC